MSTYFEKITTPWPLQGGGGVNQTGQPFPQFFLPLPWWGLYLSITYKIIIQHEPPDTWPASASHDHLYLEVLDQLAPCLIPGLPFACPGFPLDPGPGNNTGGLGNNGVQQFSFRLIGKNCLHLGERVGHLPPVNIVLFPVYFEHLITVFDFVIKFISHTSLSSPGFITGASLAHFGLSSPSHSFWCLSNLNHQKKFCRLKIESYQSLPVILRLQSSHWKDSSCFLMWELYFLSSANSRLQMLHFLNVNLSTIKFEYFTCTRPAWSCEFQWSASPACSASHTCCHPWGWTCSSHQSRQPKKQSWCECLTPPSPRSLKSCRPVSNARSHGSSTGRCSWSSGTHTGCISACWAGNGQDDQSMLKKILV